jgi:lysophospholipase L1-like esterase
LLARAAAGTAIAAAAAASLVAISLGQPAGAVAPPPYLLALGGSASVGFQPTVAHPRGQATDTGYAEDLVPLEQRRWPYLTVAHLGCPGATTVTMLGGGGHCHYLEGTQLGAAEAFLRDHPTTVLVTLDLGFNDLLPCLRHETINSACVDGALTTVHEQLGEILDGIKDAAPLGAVVVGVGHYDPYLGDYVEGAGGQAFAAASLPVMERLDSTLQGAYRSAGVPMAGVASAFELDEHQPVAWSGAGAASGGTVPDDVARTCALTWMCDPPPLGHNPHPDDAGYRTIASAIADAVAEPSDRADAASSSHASSSTVSTAASAGSAAGGAGARRQGT